MGHTLKSREELATIEGFAHNKSYDLPAFVSLYVNDSQQYTSGGGAAFIHMTPDEAIVFAHKMLGIALKAKRGEDS